MLTQKGACRGVPLHLHPRSTPCRVFMEEMATSKPCTLHLELKVPTPAVMPKINGALIRGGGSGRWRLLRVPRSTAVLHWEPPCSGAPGSNGNQAQHQFGAAPMLCRCYQGTSSPPISISSVLCFVFSGKHFHSTAKDDVFEVAIPPDPPKQWWHSPQALRLVTLQRTAFYSPGLQP